MDAKIIGNVMPVLKVTLNRGETLIADATRRIGMAPPAKGPPKPPATTRRIGVPPPVAAALEPPPADHELGPGQALPPPPWYRRPGILIAAAALIAAVGIVVLGPGEPGTAPGGILLVGTGWWTPDPTAPPAAAPPAEAPATWAPPAAAPPTWAPPTWAPPVAAPRPAAPPVAVPPPPPPPELVLRYDNVAQFVSITNNANKPAVGCVYRSVAVAGTAATIGYSEVYNFTVTGSEETRLDYHGPATGSTFHVTVTCDNGLSASRDGIY